MLYCRHIASKSGSGVDEPIFFQHRDGPILPTLRFVHMYPEVEFTSVTVDKGAIPFLLGGANIMCPGLTNVGEPFTFVHGLCMQPFCRFSDTNCLCFNSLLSRRRNAT